MKLNFLFFLAILPVCFCLHAQIPAAPVALPTPNAANLGTYGNYPVSYFTGAADVTIPLHTISGGATAMPLSLNYHSSGFRPDVHPGWVGMDWTLSAGGVINRVVNDESDEWYFTQGGASQPTLTGYLWPAFLNVAAWDQKPAIDNIAKNLYINDTEPDKFTFSLPGYSGEFYRSAEGGLNAKWQVKCDKPITVDFIPNTLNDNGWPLLTLPYTYPNGGYYATSIAGFVITVEDGTQYMFGHPSGTPTAAITAIEYSMNMFNQRAYPWIATAWYLTKVTSPKGPVTNLTYARDIASDGEFTCAMYSSLNDYVSNGQNTTSGGFFAASFSCYQASTAGLPGSYGGHLLAPVYLSSIETPTEKVTFYRSTSTEKRYDRAIFSNNYLGTGTVNSSFPYLEDPNWNANGYSYTLDDCLARLQWKQLDSIQITTQGTRLRSAAFTYTHDSTVPLTLLNVQEKGVRAYKPAYQLSYYTGQYKNVTYASLPPYVSNQVDHWGYFNNHFSFPNRSQSNYWLDYKLQREASTDRTVYLSGMLAKITYPTGGSTEFEYTQHQYSSQLAEVRSGPLTTYNSPQIAGGVRVSKMRSYSPENPANGVEKEYFYVSNYTSGADINSLPCSGVMGGVTSYYFANYTVPATDGGSGSFTQNVFSSQPVLPGCLNAQGSPIGYTQVVEKQSDGGYTKYTFSNFDNGYKDETASPNNTLQSSHTAYEPYSSLELERGKLLSEENYDKNNHKVRQKTIAYAAQNKDVEADGYVRAVKAKSFAICGTGINYEEGTAYKVYTFSFPPIQEIETVFDENGLNGVATIKNYLYDDYTHRLVKSVTETDSKGLTVESRYKYPLDFAYGSATPNDPTAKGIALMRGPIHMVGLPIETTHLRNGNLMGATVALYAEFLPNQVLPSQVLERNPVQPLPLGQYTSPSFSDMTAGARFVIDPNLTPILSLSNYDSNGNPSSVTNRGALTTSYLWGYAKTYPIAKVENADVSQIFHSNFEEGLGWQTSATPSAYTNFSYDTQQSRTGTTAGVMYCPDPQNMNHSFSTTPLTISLTATKKFVLSGWVYSEGPTAQLWLFMYQPGQTGYNYTQVDYVAINPSTPGNTNQWVYLEKEIDVPASITSLNCRLTNYYNGASTGGGRVWFDDVRIHPADAKMTTYTHRPGIGMTSISDANNRPVIYEYDGLSRLWVTRDQNRNIVKHYQYNYRQ